MAAAGELLKLCRFVSTKQVVFRRCYATRPKRPPDIDKKKSPRFDSTAKSLAAKGFLRSQKEYTPPEDLTTKLDGLFKSVVGTTAVDHKLGNLQQNFQLLIACEKEFNHAVPNSQLHEMRTLGDVKRFYETTIDLRTPLDRLKSIELPENLHIQHEYHRFHPETDTKFNGVTAFPGRSTYVTGLKYKEKYKGHMQDHKYPCT